MSIRRVVTGHSGEKAVLVSDGPPPTVYTSRAIPGSVSALLWETAAPPSVPQEGEAVSAATTFLPALGESRLLVITFPPDGVMTSPDFDPAAAGREAMEQTPDLASRFEPDNPGMHTTDTVDYAIVLDGEVWLELDDGEQVHLGPRDIVVQNGTRHGWRNKTDKPATLAFVLIGAARTG